MMQMIRSSEKSILARATRCNIPEDGILNTIAILKIYGVYSVDVKLPKCWYKFPKEPHLPVCDLERD
jgi:hypothetical protein